MNEFGIFPQSLTDSDITRMEAMSQEYLNVMDSNRSQDFSIMGSFPSNEMSLNSFDMHQTEQIGNQNRDDTENSLEMAEDQQNSDTYQRYQQRDFRNPFNHHQLFSQQNHLNFQQQNNQNFQQQNNQNFQQQNNQNFQQQNNQNFQQQNNQNFQQQNNQNFQQKNQRLNQNFQQSNHNSNFLNQNSQVKSIQLSSNSSLGTPQSEDSFFSPTQFGQFNQLNGNEDSKLLQIKQQYVNQRNRREKLKKILSENVNLKKEVENLKSTITKLQTQITLDQQTIEKKNQEIRKYEQIVKKLSSRNQNSNQNLNQNLNQNSKKQHQVLNSNNINFFVDALQQINKKK
ncbi:hypothetical protein M0811_03183 [Anaeramoeba ignava]|uniref:Uncharacterized protein n=1 Tax=Anaeramoeba ignava TaxID=1746090 RepID=A0A9Q0R5K0_ANAIG|nr:hypothetical protein M0811_03183 [Anaeramoeba ignava]